MKYILIIFLCTQVYANAILDLIPLIQNNESFNYQYALKACENTAVPENIFSNNFDSKNPNNLKSKIFNTLTLYMMLKRPNQFLEYTKHIEENYPSFNWREFFELDLFNKCQTCKGLGFHLPRCYKCNSTSKCTNSRCVDGKYSSKNIRGEEEEKICSICKGLGKCLLCKDKKPIDCTHCIGGFKIKSTLLESIITAKLLNIEFQLTKDEERKLEIAKIINTKLAKYISLVKADVPFNTNIALLETFYNHPKRFTIFDCINLQSLLSKSDNFLQTKSYLSLLFPYYSYDAFSLKNAMNDCIVCQGKGKLQKICQKCKGSKKCSITSCKDGQITRLGISENTTQECPSCKGTSICKFCLDFPSYKCNKCNSGKVSDNSLLKNNLNKIIAKLEQAIITENKRLKKLEDELKRRKTYPPIIINMN